MDPEIEKVVKDLSATLNDHTAALSAMGKAPKIDPEQWAAQSAKVETLSAEIAKLTGLLKPAIPAAAPVEPGFWDEFFKGLDEIFS